jgi:hypothetical protein
MTVRHHQQEGLAILEARILSTDALGSEKKDEFGSTRQTKEIFDLFDGVILHLSAGPQESRRKRPNVCENGPKA